MPARPTLPLALDAETLPFYSGAAARIIIVARMRAQVSSD